MRKQNSKPNTVKAKERDNIFIHFLVKSVTKRKNSDLNFTRQIYESAFICNPVY
jgi:hypothetical protein